MHNMPTQAPRFWQMELMPIQNALAPATLSGATADDASDAEEHAEDGVLPPFCFTKERGVGAEGHASPSAFLTGFDPLLGLFHPHLDEHAEERGNGADEEHRLP
jgi:hypothetical protein